MATQAFATIVVVIDQPVLHSWHAKIVAGARLTALRVSVNFSKVPLQKSSLRQYLWKILSKRCANLEAVPPNEDMGCAFQATTSGEPDIVIDLTASGISRLLYEEQTHVWRIIANGASIGAPFPCFNLSLKSGAIAPVMLLSQSANGSQELLGNAVLARRPDESYGCFLDRLYTVAVALVQTALTTNDERPGSTNASKSVAEAAVPSLANILAYAKRRLLERASAMLLTERWAIGVIDAPIESVLGRGRPAIQWLKDPDWSRYLADPFPWPASSGHLICEIYDMRRDTGILGLVSIDHGRVGSVRKIELSIPGHLSYPCVLMHDGEVFMVPESGSAGSVHILMLGSTGDWQEVARLPVTAADPTLFYWQGRFWLALSEVEIDPISSLSLWFAEHPRGPWRAHRRNPVKIDVRSARPAGTPFIFDGNLYRPAQDCSISYGGALAINRVTECTPDRFAEETVLVVSPQPESAYPSGIHTISSWNGKTLIDGKSYALELRPLMLKLALKLASCLCMNRRKRK